jgi:pSer/pThr/pTyr-binding forkhead associated (FHA) protein
VPPDRARPAAAKIGRPVGLPVEIALHGVSGQDNLLRSNASFKNEAETSAMFTHLLPQPQPPVSTRADRTMNYELHVVKGRSATTALKLTDGETSVGRHNACAIRIKSSQVSRRHCEISQKNDKLIVRDLNSSNGTIVNGKRIKEVSILQDGDELTIGGVVLRIVKVQGGGGGRTAAETAVKASDTAELDAMVDNGEDIEFEIDLDVDADEDDLGFETVPLEDDSEPTPPPKAAARAGAAPGNAAPAKPTPKAESKPSAPAKRTEEDDAVDEFLLDLRLDEE